VPRQVDGGKALARQRIQRVTRRNRQTQRGDVDATVTRPLPRPCTESASSISVVCESSMEYATTLASGRSCGGAGAVTGAKPVPLGNHSKRKRCQ